MMYSYPTAGCSCPDYWFPPSKNKNILKKVPHHFQGLAHHHNCPMNIETHQHKCLFFMSEAEVLNMIQELKKEEFLSLCNQLKVKHPNLPLEEIILNYSNDKFLSELISQLKDLCESN